MQNIYNSVLALLLNLFKSKLCVNNLTLYHFIISGYDSDLGASSSINTKGIFCLRMSH